MSRSVVLLQCPCRRPADRGKPQFTSGFHDGLPDVSSQGACADDGKGGQLADVAADDQLGRLGETALFCTAVGECRWMKIQPAHLTQEFPAGGADDTDFRPPVGDIRDRDEMPGRSRHLHQFFPRCVLAAGWCADEKSVIPQAIDV